MTPALSIVMPVLNPHPEYFPLAVSSVLGQSFGDFELIIIEAPATDPSAPDAKRLLSGSDSRLRLVQNPEPTDLRQQLNQGLGLCNAPVIARMDADDIAHQRRLEKQTKMLEEHPEIDVLGCQLRLIDGQGKPSGARRYPTDNDSIVAAMRRYNPLPHPGVVLRQEAWVEAGGYTLAGPAEDYDLWCRMARNGRRFANHPEALLDYRIHDGASKVQHLRNTLEATIAVKREYFRGELDLRERARLCVEVLALRAPPRLVLWLFSKAVTDR